MLKKILLALLIILLAMQLYRPARNLSDEQGNHLSKEFPYPSEVSSVYEKACADCHSNLTQYPWYANVQPVALWLRNHVEDGKKHFNISEFAAYSPAKQYHKLEEVVEMVHEGEMPLASYTWVHRDAILTEAEKQTLVIWANSLRDSLSAHYPQDSLVMKRRK